jgi:hypothetical protein
LIEKIKPGLNQGFQRKIEKIRKGGFVKNPFIKNADFEIKFILS